MDLNGRTITVAVWSEGEIPKEDDSELPNESLKLFNMVMLSREIETESKLNCNIERKVLTTYDKANMLSKMEA